MTVGAARRAFDAAKHDVTGELRDYHGRWSKSGGGVEAAKGAVEKGAARAKMQAAAFEPKPHASALLGLSSRTAAEQYLTHHKFTVPQLRSISAQMGVKHPSKASKAAIAGGILDQIEVANQEEFKTLNRLSHMREQGIPHSLAMDKHGNLKVTTDAEVESRIRAAYDAAPKGRTGFATLEDVRKQLGNDVPREQLDRALVAFGNHEHVILAPESNQKSLTLAQRAAAVHIGGQPKHLLKIETGKAAPFKVGFTGTQRGMTGEQKAELRARLKQVIDSHSGAEFHHGNSIGADEEAAAVAKQLGFRVVSHPPTDKSKMSTFSSDESRPPKDYLARNRDIAAGSDVLIAAPKERSEVLRSGTWATVRSARKTGTPTTTLLPSAAPNPLTRERPTAGAARARMAAEKPGPQVVRDEHGHPMAIVAPKVTAEQLAAEKSARAKPGAARAKMAKAPVDAKQLRADLLAAGDREAATRLLADRKLTAAQLVALGDELGIPMKRRPALGEARQQIAQWTVGRRGASDAISTPFPSRLVTDQTPPTGAARAKMVKAAAPSTHELASALQAAQSEAAGREVLARLGRTKAEHQALASAVGVEHRPSDTIAALKDAILRQAVTRRLEHAAYLRRRNLTD